MKILFCTIALPVFIGVFIGSANAQLSKLSPYSARCSAGEGFTANINATGVDRVRIFASSGYADELSNQLKLEQGQRLLNVVVLFQKHECTVTNVERNEILCFSRLRPGYSTEVYGELQNEERFTMSAWAAFSVQQVNNNGNASHRVTLELRPSNSMILARQTIDFGGVSGMAQKGIGNCIFDK